MAKNQKGRKMKTTKRTPCLCLQSQRILWIDHMQSVALFDPWFFLWTDTPSDSMMTNGTDECKYSIGA